LAGGRIERTLHGLRSGIRRNGVWVEMPVIKHTELQKKIKALVPEEAPGTFLIHGEELLVKTALDSLLAVLLPGETRRLNFEPVDGSEASVSAAVEKVNTYSLMAEPKVVALVDAQIFYSKQDTAAVIERARAAYRNNETGKAAQALLKVMSLLGLSYEDLAPESRADALKLTDEQRRDDHWLAELLDYCRDNSLKAPTGGSTADMLQQAITRGFPPGQYLVITTDIVDRRRNLYKAIVDKGLVIDCAVPKGDRKVDQTAQTAVLNEQLVRVLKECGKKMEPEARALLVELAGFNLRAVVNSIRQLASFTGERDTIVADDVRQVVHKTRQDPIYNFTNAITDRKRAEALFFLDSLLEENLYPLQLLAAMVNQVRKLILIKGFTESRPGTVWQTDAHYNYFRDQVLPAIVDYDRAFSAKMAAWQEAISPVAAKKKGARKKSGKIADDLLIARNPKNPYPVYQLFKKADRFSRKELFVCLELLEKADLRIKSTSLTPRLVLEEVVMAICP